MWPAIAFEFWSGCRKFEFRSGACVSTTAITLAGSQRKYFSPIRSPALTMGIGLPVGRKARAVVDVVHAFEGRVGPGVHLQDHLVSLVEPGLVVADGG